jgi:hypothetical protein
MIARSVLFYIYKIDATAVARTPVMRHCQCHVRVPCQGPLEPHQVEHAVLTVGGPRELLTFFLRCCKLVAPTCAYLTVMPTCWTACLRGQPTRNARRSGWAHLIKHCLSRIFGWINPADGRWLMWCRMSLSLAQKQAIFPV